MIRTVALYLCNSWARSLIAHDYRLLWLTTMTYFCLLQSCRRRLIQGRNQKFIGGVSSVPFLRFLPPPSLFRSPSSLSLVSKWSLRSRSGGVLLVLAPPSGGERHLQPPETFAGLWIHKNVFCGGKTHFFVYSEPSERLWWLQMS